MVFSLSDAHSSFFLPKNAALLRVSPTRAFPNSDPQNNPRGINSLLLRHVEDCLRSSSQLPLSRLRLRDAEKGGGGRGWRGEERRVECLLPQREGGRQLFPLLSNCFAGRNLQTQVGERGANSTSRVNSK